MPSILNTIIGLKTTKILLTIAAILIIWVQQSFAQFSDSTWVKNTDSTNIILYYPNSPFSSKDTAVLDTTLFYFQRYDSRVADYDMAAGTMTIGGPIKDLYFSSFSPQFSIGEQSLANTFTILRICQFMVMLKSPTPRFSIPWLVREKTT